MSKKSFIPQSAVSSQPNTRIQSAVPRLVAQSSPLERSSRSETPRRVDQNLKTTHRSTQRTTSVEDSRPTVTPVQAKPKHTIVPHSQFVSPPSLPQELSIPTVRPGSPKECNSSIVTRKSKGSLTFRWFMCSLMDTA